MQHYCRSRSWKETLRNNKLHFRCLKTDYWRRTCTWNENCFYRKGFHNSALGQREKALLIIQKILLIRQIRALFRKAWHACSMNLKGHISLNFGQFKDETSLTASKYKVFGVWKSQKKFRKGYHTHTIQ